MNSARLTLGLLFCWFFLPGTPWAAGAGTAVALRLSQPLDYQVYQRATRAEGKITVAGRLEVAATQSTVVEARIADADATTAWRTLATLAPGTTEFHAEFAAPAGGWHRLETRARHEESVVAVATVGHVGVGEVFVIAGQSNSANHGAEKQHPKSGLVAAQAGDHWRLADDPQPGASGNGGSFIPPFADAIAERFKVPVGIIATGVGATSVREWLPEGTRFPNPPTLTGHVTRHPAGEWASKGELFNRLVARVKPLGPQGFRAVLWHQGESDANQQDTSRTLPGNLYRQLLEQLIRESRRATGWEFPWFIALASYHTPDDAGSSDIRASATPQTTASPMQRST